MSKAARIYGITTAADTFLKFSTPSRKYRYSVTEIKANPTPSGIKSRCFVI